MALTQTNRLAKLYAPSHLSKLVLQSVDTVERLSAPYEVRAVVHSETADIELDNLLGIPFGVEYLSDDGVIRGFNGRCAQAVFAGTLASGFLFQLTLRPDLWFLSLNRRSRIFQNMTVPAIIAQVLSDAGPVLTDPHLGSYPQRVFVVQYEESDFDFVSRLMEQEGIHYFFRQDKDSNVMVIADSNGEHKPVPRYENVTFFPPGRQPDRKKLYLDGWTPRSSVMSPHMMHLTDFNFEKPKPIETEEKAQFDEFLHDFVVARDYPGGFTEEGDGKRYAKIRLESERAQRGSAYGGGNAVALKPGATFSFSGHPMPSENKDYLVVEARTRVANNAYRSGGMQATAPRIDIVAIPADTPFRPLVVTRRPRILGTQTAIVTGKSGEEIETDKYGRIKVHFHWDISGAHDDTSSCWIRVAQIWAGAKWGALFTPRVDQEVLVEFIDGDPDRPIVTGSVYNGEHELPYTLPKDKSKSTIKSNSYPHGGGFNELRFEDRKGQEEIYMHAQQNMNVVVLNNLSTSVGYDETRVVENSRKTTIKKDNDELTIKMGDRKTKLEMGDDATEIQVGNQDTKITLGAQTTNALQKIELTVGANSITIDQTGVTIKGIMVQIEGIALTNVKAPMLQLQGQGMAMLQGGIVMIN